MKKKILVVGDVILDRYIIGETVRISPEAPVPIVKVDAENIILGGAANVAHNLVNLGADVFLLGGIGKDKYGSEVRSLIAGLGMVDYLVDSGIETTTKTRILSRNQQMMRIDRESLFVHSQESIKKIIGLLNNLNFDMIVVSDYAKGFVTNELMEILQGFDSKIIVDPKGNDWEKYRGCYLIKPNLVELKGYHGNDIMDQLDNIAEVSTKIVKDLNLNFLIVTRGSKGMVLTDLNRSVEYPTQIVEVFDVTGAGDTAISVLAFELIRGSGIDKSINCANIASAFVVTKSLTYAISSKEYQNLTT